MTNYPTKPLLRIKQALDELLQNNERTRGRVTGEMYLGRDIFIVRLREPRIILGEWEDVEHTIDIFELIDAHEQAQDQGVTPLVNEESILDGR